MSAHLLSEMEALMSNEDIQRLLASLHALSPMPDDTVLEEEPERIDDYTALVNAIAAGLEHGADITALRYLIHSFGPDDGFEVYWETVHVIEAHRSDQVYDEIRQAATNGPVGVRKWCCIMLGRRGDPSDIPVLVKNLASDDSRVTIAALDAIRSIGSRNRVPEVISIVQPMINHPQPNVASAARDALQELTR